MELNEPLGMRPPRQPPPKRRTWIVVVALSGVALGAIGAFFLTADPRGGDPYAVATIPPPAGKLDLSAIPQPDPTPTGSLGKPGSFSVGSLENGIKVFRGGRDAPGTTQAAPPPGPLVIDVTRVLDDPQRKRTTPGGDALPVLSSPHAGSSATPRIAIFVSGMGLSDTATRAAVETMPPAVDLAFVPYGAAAQASIDAAKAKGHEILLQIPMQTAQGAPGPHALQPDEAGTELAEDISWLMDRVRGYSGVTNLLGAPVTSNAATMTPLLKAVAARGAFYLDDGTSTRSLATSLAAQAGVTVLKADVLIDATGDPNIVRANLTRLATLALQNGHAIGMASGLPDHMATIARFAADLGGQGIDLVPLGTLAGHDASIATAR